MPNSSGKQIVLLGAGHAHLYALRAWGMQPIAGASLVCISDFPYSAYSGMLPGVLAGEYLREEMRIDLVRLCAASGIRLVTDPVVSIDRAGRHLLFDDRPPLDYDFLSINVGSVPRMPPGMASSDRVLPIKPMQTFPERLDDHCGRLRRLARPARIAVCGGGVGGVETALCLGKTLEASLERGRYTLELIHAGERIASELATGTRRRIEAELQRQSIRVRPRTRIVRIEGAEIVFEDDEREEVDLVVWAADAVAPPLLECFDLPRDERGFLRTDASLRSLGDARIFAVGDAGTSTERPTPKAGVYSVRQGPVLWDNLLRACEGAPLRRYRPQSGFLKLINLGDSRAVAEYKGFSLQGQWCRRWKDRIDRKFMSMYQDPVVDALPMSRNSSLSRTAPERCRGCGGKAPSTMLGEVLERLHGEFSDGIAAGIRNADDAAVIDWKVSSKLVASTDLFVPPLGDAWLDGRIAALHSLSDAYAMGSRPTAALIQIAIPEDAESREAAWLEETLRGVLRELSPRNVTLLGGHTLVAQEPLLGLTILAEPVGSRIYGNDQLRVGDRLILTKPLGVGILLRARMLARCRWDWYATLLDGLLLGNEFALELVPRFDVGSMTDVTGFGLAGHLREQLLASSVSATLRLDAMPLLPGVEELLEEEIESTLAPSNRSIEQEIGGAEKFGHRSEYRALFDPQTNGGLLVSVRASESADCVAWLQAEWGLPASEIGEVRVLDPAEPRICVE